jgi:hypothetical protein
LSSILYFFLHEAPFKSRASSRVSARVFLGTGDLALGLVRPPFARYAIPVDVSPLSQQTHARQRRIITRRSNND